MVVIGCARDEVRHHRNHVCASGLEYDMTFGRTDDEFIEVLEVLRERDLGAWPQTDTPDVGERYIVERMLGKQPQLQHEPVKDTPTQPKEFFELVDDLQHDLIMKHVKIQWGPRARPITPKQILVGQVQQKLKAEQPKNGWDVLTPELKARIGAMLDEYEAGLT